MNTNRSVGFSAGRPRAGAAFTLLELLVVIAIIALLAGILLPVAASVMQNAHKTQAKNTEVQIVAAITSYQTDYGVYPVLTTTQSGKDTTVGPGVQDNAELFDILRALPLPGGTTSPNTRAVVYFEGKDVKNPGNPLDGFIPTGATLSYNDAGKNTVSVVVGDMVDPWGDQYYVSYDTGYDNQLNNPYLTTPTQASDSASTQPASAIRTGVISWCYGADGKEATGGSAPSGPPIASYGDDVVSWN